MYLAKRGPSIQYLKVLIEVRIRLLHQFIAFFIWNKQVSYKFVKQYYFFHINTADKCCNIIKWVYVAKITLMCLLLRGSGVVTFLYNVVCYEFPAWKCIIDRMIALFPTQMFFQDGYLFYLADKKCKRVISRYQRQKDTESISLAGILIMICQLIFQNLLTRFH